jgi:hypothetical protein
VLKLLRSAYTEYRFTVLRKWSTNNSNLFDITTSNRPHFFCVAFGPYYPPCFLRNLLDIIDKYKGVPSCLNTWHTPSFKESSPFWQHGNYAVDLGHHLPPFIESDVTTHYARKKRRQKLSVSLISALIIQLEIIALLFSPSTYSYCTQNDDAASRIDNITMTNGHMTFVYPARAHQPTIVYVFLPFFWRVATGIV